MKRHAPEDQAEAGALFRAWRRAQRPRITVEAAAAAVGISGSYLGKFELGLCSLSLQWKTQISVALPCPLSVICTPSEMQTLERGARALVLGVPTDDDGEPFATICNDLPA